MADLVVSQFVSADGVMETPERWMFPYIDDSVQAFTWDQVSRADSWLLGRTTWEGFAGHFPNQHDEFGDLMNRMRKYVVSSTLADADGWTNSRVISGDVETEVARLKREASGEILISGSLRLVRSLLPTGLIDRYRFITFPVAAGAGQRLFPEDRITELRLEDVRRFDSGAVLLSYTPAAA